MKTYEAVIIGSGFGGSISACRLAKKWPGEVLVLERGKRYPMGSFPRSPHDMAHNFWNLPEESCSRPDWVPSHEVHGLFDIRNYDHMDALVAAGVGGGSLIYANVFMEPPDHVFEQGWPENCSRESLRPYYDVVKSVLGSRPIPQNDDPRRRIPRTELFQEVAKEMGRDSELVDINVFFGNDFDHPTDIGVQEENRFGAVQTSCVYCAECDVGCNTHSKNTLDLNYLYVAEHRYRAEVLPEHLALRIVPVDSSAKDDSTENGVHGYRVYYVDLDAGTEGSVLAKRVIVSAGTLGTNELLLRCRDVDKTLPSISANLGKRFSGNGDFLSFAVEGDRPSSPNYGPVITQRTDYNLFEDFKRDEAFILEDAGYPAFAGWYLSGARPAYSSLAAIWNIVKSTLALWFQRKSTGRIGYAFSEWLAGDVSTGTCVFLCMGLDRGNGTLELDKEGRIRIDWPYKDSLSLYEAILRAGKEFSKRINAKHFFALPNWWFPLRKNVTVHAVGGCILSDSPDDGVTSADPSSFGQVYGYTGLFVADGAIVPTAVGANPTATISALCERVAEGITEMYPNKDL